MNPGHERNEVNAEGLAKRSQFDNIYPSLASFTLADEGLGLAETLCELSLGKASAPACFTKARQKELVLARYDRFLHPKATVYTGPNHIVSFGIVQSRIFVSRQFKRDAAPEGENSRNDAGPDGLRRRS